MPLRSGLNAASFSYKRNFAPSKVSLTLDPFGSFAGSNLTGRFTEEGILLQRLYSTFPDGRPGFGLLLLRLAAGGSLIADRFSMMVVMPSSLQWEIQIAFACVGVFILLGIWTPVMGAFGAAGEALIIISRPTQYQSHFLIAVLALGLVMLGPGAWSIDALIFGRKRITI
jgi:putative oxidoreductase